jgi:hypothetical protein
MILAQAAAILPAAAADVFRVHPIASMKIAKYRIFTLFFDAWI